MATFKRFEDIEAWQLARVLSKEIFEETQLLPWSKDYKLVAQINDASGSVMNNIVEGYGRGSRLEFVQFLGFSQGSSTETQSQLYQAMDRNYITKDQFEYFYNKAKSIEQKIENLILYLNKTEIKGTKFKGRTN
ncbi:MAG: four helix bundle protein [Bacteroidia bacterium]|jgi:four helix bundle protein|nr:four helix bundle protein [Bacteroidia bacterium]